MPVKHRSKHTGTALSLALLLLLPWQTLQAAGTVDRIYQAADDFMTHFVAGQQDQGRNVTYELGSLDDRLSMDPCPNPLTVSFSGDPEKTVRNTLLVSCEGNRPWRLFLNSTIEIKTEGWVTRHPISRGTVLDKSMLEPRPVTINEQRQGSYQDPKHMIGMEARRNINAGVPLTPQLLVTPDAVSRGERVIISAGNSTFAIETRGEALHSGKVGDQISVRNESSGRRIRGRIVAPGRVSIH